VVAVVAVELGEKVIVTVQGALHGLFVKEAVTPVGSVDRIEKVTDTLTFALAVIDDDKLPPPWTSVTLVREGGNRIKLGSTAFTEPASRTGKM
jgi:hypothetical protein